MAYWVHKICLWWVYLASIFLLLIISVTIINAGAFGLDKIARLFDAYVTALSGYEDFIRLAISAVAFMFFPWAQLQKGHIAIDFFTQRLSQKTQHILDIFWLFLTLCLVFFLALMMSFGLLETRADGALSSILGWIEWPFYIPGIISLVLWSMVLSYQIFELIRIQKPIS